MAKQKADGFEAASYDVWLDARAPHNQNVRFAPAGITLAGDYRLLEEASDKPLGILNAIGGEIPGQRMLVDTRSRQVKVVHKMTLPENKEKDKALRRIVQNERFMNARFTDYPGDIDFSPSEEEWPTWLYTMRRCVNHGTLKLVRGSLPSEEEIRRLGPIIRTAGGRMPDKEPFYKLPKLDDKQLVGAGK